MEQLRAEQEIQALEPSTLVWPSTVPQTLLPYTSAFQDTLIVPSLASLSFTNLFLSLIHRETIPFVLTPDEYVLLPLDHSYVLVHSAFLRSCEPAWLRFWSGLIIDYFSLSAQELAQSPCLKPLLLANTAASKLLQACLQPWPSRGSALCSELLLNTWYL